MGEVRLSGGGGGGAFGGADAYAGTWAPSTNTPTLADGSGLQGTYYICSDDGDVNLGSGTQEFTVYDVVIYRAGIWTLENRHPMPENLLINTSGALIVNAANEFVWRATP